jgi:glycyl-tRNA synthetase beta chain
MAGELLVELLSEEIPARMQRRAVEELAGHLGEWLRVHRIPAVEPIKRFVTPRRLTLIADGIPARQPDDSEERRGPRLGSPQQAIDGFLRSVGLTSIDQCEVRDDRYFALIERLGRDTADVLPDIIHATMNSLSWPKSMRFPASPLRWVRPLSSVICLFDGNVVPLALDRVPVGRLTRGHRFLAPAEIEVTDAADYLKKLEKAQIVLDQDRRREIIAADLDRLAEAEGLTIKDDPALLDEVTGLVECPVVLMGRIDDEFVRPLPEGLPPEVLATAMRTHQKYFSCLNADGTPAPRFLFVANNRTPDGGKTIVAGNERVLRARLADARFFWEQDRKVRLEDRVEALKERVYYDKLGTMLDKTERMERLAGYLATLLHPVAPAQAGAQGGRSDLATLDPRFRGDDGDEPGYLAVRAARLAKADLSTGMVGEFPELQGVMGRYYALNDGDDPRVAEAIAEHYKPLGPNDTCPTRPVSVVLALADKLDALVGFYAIDEKPTGSRDPFALRRAALGIARIILENQIKLSLNMALRFSFEGFRTAQFTQPAGLVGFNILTFIVDRLKIHLRENGVRPDLISASVYREPLVHDDDLLRILSRQATLASFLDTDNGANLLIAYRRAANIVAIEERRDDHHYADPVDFTLLREPAEERLYEALGGLNVTLEAPHAAEDFARTMRRLATLRQPVDEFFDKVTVNTDDRNLRENRLRLLSRIRDVMNQVADFSQIEG